MTEAIAEVLKAAHGDVQWHTERRRSEAQRRTEIARQVMDDLGRPQAIREIQALLGLSRTGVVKILAGTEKELQK